MALKFRRAYVAARGRAPERKDVYSVRMTKIRRHVNHVYSYAYTHVNRNVPPVLTLAQQSCPYTYNTTPVAVNIALS